MEHTKTPWMVAGQKPGNCGPQQEQDRLIYTKDENGHPLHIAETFQYQNHGHNAADVTSINNAAFIVRAVNMHERLVEGLRKLYDVLMQDGKPPFVGEGDERVYQLVGGQMSNTLDIIRALLAEEEKEESHAND